MENEAAEKKTSIKKKLLIAFAVLIAVWLLVSVLWYIWREVTYSPYVENIEQNGYSDFLVPSYVVNVDNCSYSVKYPGYLSLTGNLGVWPDDDILQLIIWPELDGSYSYGIRLEADDTMYYIYIDEYGNAIDEGDSELTEQYRDKITSALDAADNFWNLK